MLPGMALPVYSYPASGAVARGVGLAPFRSGIAIADWTTPVLWPYVEGSGFSAAVMLGSGTPGLSAIAADAASGVYAVSYTGTLYHVPSAGAVSGNAMPSGSVYTGCAFAAGSAFVM